MSKYPLRIKMGVKEKTSIYEDSSTDRFGDSVAFVSAAAQQASIKRTPVGSIDLPPDFTTVTAIAEVSGRRIRPGIESGYVLEGDVVLKIEGNPERVFKADQRFPNPANTPHDVYSVGGFKTISTYVVECGKSLPLPAP